MSVSAILFNLYYTSIYCICINQTASQNKTKKNGTVFHCTLLFGYEYNAIFIYLKAIDSDNSCTLWGHCATHTRASDRPPKTLTLTCQLAIRVIFNCNWGHVYLTSQNGHKYHELNICQLVIHVKKIHLNIARKI